MTCIGSKRYLLNYFAARKKGKIQMNKRSLYLIILAITWGIVGFHSSQPVLASSVHFNKAPKVIKGMWATKTLKIAKKYRNNNNYYWTNGIYVNNKNFSLEGHTFTKHMGSVSNTGRYGTFSGDYHRLAFRKVSSRSYVLTGDRQPMFDKVRTGYKVILSKDHKSMKVYYYAKVKRSGYVGGHKHYEGNFFRYHMH